MTRNIMTGEGKKPVEAVTEFEVLFEPGKPTRDGASIQSISLLITAICFFPRKTTSPIAPGLKRFQSHT